jgi:SAM-dependent methyltransferase
LDYVFKKENGMVAPLNFVARLRDAVIQGRLPAAFKRRAALVWRKVRILMIEDKDAFAQSIMQSLRAEYTVMPRFGFHQPLDYNMVTLPPPFEAPVIVEGEPLPLPPPLERMGYSEDNTAYLEWGKYDRDLIMSRLGARNAVRPNMKILDFGCSSGRVLRHFHEQQQSMGWELYGVDVQARPIEWMRQNFPESFKIYTGNTLPHLPFEDNTFDAIYGFSVFTHIKYQWDAWILELRRVLKPGGVLLQTIHTEHAWKKYYDHREQDWVKGSHTPRVYDYPEMDVPFLYYGDISVSQVFWTRDVAHKYWSRYMRDVEIYLPAEKNSFQDMVVSVK